MDEPNAILSGFWGQCERLQMDHDLFEKSLDLADTLVHVPVIQGWSRFLSRPFKAATKS